MPTAIPGISPFGARLVMDQQLLAGGVSAIEPLQTYEPPIQGEFYVIGPDNSEHALWPFSGVYRLLDESGYMFTPASAPSRANHNLGIAELAYPGDSAYLMGPAAGTITDPHGNVYTAGSITDPDGNSITFPDQAISNVLPATDSTGRIIPGFTNGNVANCPTLSGAQYQPITGASLWTPPGSGPGYLFCYASVNIYTNIWPIQSGWGTQYIRTVNMIQSVVLPNGQYWGFIYDSSNPNSPPTASTPPTSGLGQLLTLIYPTGGSVNYTYGFGQGFCNSARPTGTNPNGAAIIAFPSEVLTRTMKDAQGNNLGTWTYGAPDGGTTGTILSPTNDLTVTKFVGDPNSPCGILDAGENVYEGPSTSGTLLRSTSKTYTSPVVPPLTAGSAFLPSGPRETLASTKLASGETSSVQTSYAPSVSFSALQCDSSGDNCVPSGSGTSPIGGPTSKTYVDYSGSTIKQETTSFEWQGNASYLVANLLDIPANTAILDGAGVQRALTTYFYDESSYSSGGIRGHNTTTTKWLNSTGTSPTIHTGWNPRAC